MSLESSLIQRSIISPSRLAIILFAAAGLTWAGYRAYERAQLSPFVMGTVRAGMPFSVVDDEAKREMGHGFTCQKIDSRVKSCRLITDTPIGELKIVTDRWGRAAVIQLLVTDSSGRWTDAARQTAAEWSLVHSSQPAYAEPTTSVTRWESDNHRWSAQLARQDETHRPVEMLVVDADRLGRIAEASPSTLLRLANEGMISRADLVAAEKYASGAIAKAVDSMSADGIALARKASAIPRCPPKSGDEVVQGEGFRNTMGPELSAIAEQTFAQAYPGSKLVLGEKAAYLVDGSGAAEEIMLYPNAENAESGLHAFAVTFPRRVAASEAAARAFQTDAGCRASAEVIVANVDPSSRRVIGYRRVELDRESSASAVGTLDFTPTPSGHPALLATYLATYGAAQWYGQVKWNALIDVGPSIVVVKRAPTSGTKTDADGVVRGGVLVPEQASSDDAWGFTLQPGPQTQMSVLDLTNPTVSRRVFLLAGSDGLASGWTLLSQL